MRRNAVFTTTITAVAVTALASLGHLARAQHPVEQPGFPQSVGMQLKNHNFATKDLQQVKAMGLGAVRKGVYWDWVEKEPGKYDFSKFDRLVQDTEEMGLVLVACLFGNNALHENDDLGGIQTEAGRQGFANFAAAMAGHYKGKKHIIWEIWNEPNIRTFWRKDGMHNSEPYAQEYAQLVNATVPAMLEADPACFVAAGSVSNYWEPSYQWTEFCFQNNILKSGIRAWSVHPYGLKTPEEFTIGHDRTRSLLKQYGAPDLPIINTERGFSVEFQQNTAEGWSGGSREQALEYQAWHFVRQVLVDQLNNVGLTVWYEWDGGDSWTGSAFALLNQDGSSRPAGVAAQVLLKQLDGARLVRRVETGYARDYALLFENGSGNHKLVVWTSPEPGDDPDGAIPHTVKITGADPASAVDIYGKPAGAEVQGDVLHLTASGAPLYVSIASIAALRVESVEPPKPVAAERPAAIPDSGTDLKLFDSDAHWTFHKNTGDGSFTVKRENDYGVGVLAYDFTNSKSSSTPYVIANADTVIPEGASRLLISARSELAQNLTFRVVDSTGQVHQFKSRVDGTGGWETITFPLNRKLEHWGGANDGTIHFPIKQVSFSVPSPGKDRLKGKVEYSQLVVVSSGQVAPQPDLTAAAADRRAPLDVFKPGAGWEFLKNTGEGGFRLDQADDGTPIGVLSYDFSNSTTSSVPYVLAHVPINVDQKADKLELKVRSDIPQKLTFRIVDASGQTHQFKATKQKAGDEWERIQIPLDRKLEHWGGNNDGVIQYPIKSLVFSVPRPDGSDHLAGQVEYAELKVQLASP